MTQNPKYDNDMVNLGYLNKRLGQTEESINKNNNSISQLPKNYSIPPNPPYYKDSLLCYGNKIYRCNTTKLKGEFSWNDWTIVATDDTTLSDFVKNTYELDKLEIQEQIDGKIQTYYQENDPSKDWVTDLDKGRHIGDYWYNTTNDTQWRYNRIITGSTITYGWGQVNIPKAVFDTIDSKKSIYTEKPTSYQKDDLWIIEEWILDEDLPIGTDENPIARGDWVFSVANSDTYNKEHWVKRDEDISMTYIKQHYYTIGEIDSSFEEIERNTDSKITKAKDEISLSVEQTYTTKEEHKATIYDFDEKIGTINQTITEHKETISDLSIEVGEITSTVESIETTTKNLEIDIDGVSADFEDFKDNEYIQSIDNLQKQIDGAIQFWNGAEIPTINNYPANEWTTDKDKINHQADIYTVVQDVEGEMKQGKSYRFDKIDGVWQWIELTDNELSAVQAIAQEALNKANANATEIGTVKTRVSSLEQTDEQIKASVESIDKQIIPTNTVSDSNIYIADASENPLVKLEIEGKSEQATRSGKNKFNYTEGLNSSNQGITNILNSDHSITTSGVPTINWNAVCELREITDILDDETKYTISQKTVSPYVYLQITVLTLDQSEAIYISSGYGPDSFTVNKSKYRYYAKIQCCSMSDWGTESRTITNTYQLEKGDAVTEFEKYGVSPSPDYPSEIESVGYENLFDKEAITENYLYEDGGVFTPATTYNTSDYISCKSNEYIVSAKFAQSNPYIRYIVAEFDENKTYIQRQLNTDSNSPKYAFTLNVNTKYIRLSYRKDATLYDIQIEKGSILHPYIPFGKYGIEVEIIGKQLLDINNVTNGYRLGSDGTPFAATEYWLSDYIKVKSSSNYTYSRNATGDSQAYAFYDKDKNFISRNFMTNSTIINISTTNATKYIRIADISTSLEIAQLEEGTTSTEYEPYFSKLNVFILDEPLRSLPNRIRDIATIQNGVLSVTRNVGYKQIKPTMINNYINSLTYSKEARVNKSDIGNIPNKAIGSLICNTFRLSGTWNVDEIGIFSNAGTLNEQIALRIPLEEDGTYFDTHPTYLQYELETPYIEEIGPLEIPSTFKGVSHISTTDDLEPTINIEYVRDTVLSDYVEGQIEKVMNIQERNYSELVIEDDLIKESVTEISSNLSDMSQDVHTVQETLTSTEKTLEVISTNIDKTTGEIREVTTINGYKFNKDGLNIYTNENSFNTLIDNEGTYYKDGDAIISETTKDGFMATSIKNKGSEEYCYDESNKVYDFIKERIEVDGEYGYATFYNGVN